MRRQRAKSRAFITAIALAAACTIGATSDARSLRQVLNEGTLRVGIALYAPWAIRTDDGRLIGFEIDVARQLAADMGVEVEFQIYAWDRIIRGLEAGEIDIIAAGLSITPQRALHVNFSRPYAEGGIGLATRLDRTADVAQLSDLDDPAYRIAVVAGTVAEELATRILPRTELVTFMTPEEASTALETGEVDGYVEDEPVPTFLALEHPTTIDVPLARPLLRTQAGFAVAKGDPDFLAFLDAWITARETDTWLPTIHDFWFDSLRWRTQLESVDDTP